MQTYSIQVDYPENLLHALQTTPDSFKQEARMAMAVKLFEMKRLSSGMAAQLIGIDRVTFLLQLSQHNVPMIDLNSGELESDLANA